MRLRRVICMLLAAVIVLGFLPVSSLAAEMHPNTYVNSGDNRADIMGVARTQVGYYETGNNRTKYGAWYGLDYNPWCAMYISWCARQAGVPTWIIKNSARARPHYDGFGIPYYDGASYTPSVGDIFFKREFEHTGFVYHVDGDYFYTIEGNSTNDGTDNGNRVLCLKRKISDYYFGVPVC